jgi:hypothetical protein
VASFEFARRRATTTAAELSRDCVCDRAQRHVRGLLDKVAFVTGFALNEGEAPFEQFVAGGLVMHGETPQQRKSRALLELVASAAPLIDLGPRVWRAVEKVEA